MIKRLEYALLICGFFAFSIIPAAHAVPLNGGFESGLDDWGDIGVAQTIDSSIGSGPTEGAFQAFVVTDPLTTAGDVLGFFGPPVSFSGISSFSDSGSAIKQNVVVNAGDILTFDFNYLTDDRYDFAFFVADQEAIFLADWFDTGIGSSTPFRDETGYLPYTYTFLTSGAQTIGFGVINEFDPRYQSALLIDNVAITTITTVPLPAALPLMLSGLGMLGFVARRQQRQV